MTWRPGRVDLVLFLVAVAAAWGALVAHLEPDQQAATALSLVGAAAVAVPVLVAQRHPVGALLANCVLVYAYYALGLPAIGLILPLAPALFVAARAGHLRFAGVLGGGFLALSIVFRVVSATEAEPIGTVIGYDGATQFALLCAVLALGDAVHARRGWSAELAHRLRLADEEREADAHRRVEEERLRIARDVHDSLGHAVAVVTLHAAVGAEALDDDDPAAARRALETIRSVSRDVLGDLRDTVGLLREPAGDLPRRRHGLAELPDLVEATTTAGLDARLVVEGIPRPWPAAVEATAHRVVQEALTNVLRHATATQVTVTVDHGTDHLTISVVDDGRGSTAPDGTGHGLSGMRERVGLLGGRLLAGNRPGGGFGVCAVLPVAADRVRVPA
ncbi:sensor histidine kinase [Blastococcus litoris]|uniref:sensor histidine kinase n=1 Tax=Blastococcus litoris TaxID=2171622 RepID=UPI0013E01965|nr:histidine kinase [Blastococcus litoris]